MNSATCPPPRFVFVCGAVGSGNTLLFDCLTRDSRTYGINEDALGSTLHRFIRSESDFGRCPHCLDAYLHFLDALRRDRDTLVLKTPSNLRHKSILERHIPDARFLITVREPHAAIASGTFRHDASKSVREIGEIWLRDYSLALKSLGDAMIVPFEHMVTTPETVLKMISSRIMPVAPSVFEYAASVTNASRGSPGWWRSKVGDKTAARIERCVEELRLGEFYETLVERSGLSVTRITGTKSRFGRIARAREKLREWAVKGWYRVKF